MDRCRKITRPTYRNCNIKEGQGQGQNEDQRTKDRKRGLDRNKTRNRNRTRHKETERRLQGQRLRQRQNQTRSYKDRRSDRYNVKVETARDRSGSRESDRQVSTRRHRGIGRGVRTDTNAVLWHDGRINEQFRWNCRSDSFAVTHTDFNLRLRSTEITKENPNFGN